jgi:hypothetical protein
VKTSLNRLESYRGPTRGSDARRRGFPLSAEQRDDLIAFLRSLTDEPLLHDRRFSNPWSTGSSVH